jgi:hypothetical protein
MSWGHKEHSAHDGYSLICGWSEFNSSAKSSSFRGVHCWALNSLVASHFVHAEDAEG